MKCFCPVCGLELKPNQKYNKRMCQVCGFNIRETWEIFEKKDKTGQLRSEETKRIEGQQQTEQLSIELKNVKNSKKQRTARIITVLVTMLSIFVIGYSGFLLVNVKIKLDEKLKAESVYFGNIPLGTKTQSGGTVVYDKGNYEGGWRYLECSAPFAKDTVWSLEGQYVEGLSSEIGYGDENTWKIVHAKGIETAAGVAMNYSSNDTLGWYLPNTKEAKLVVKTLKLKLPFWVSEMDGEKAYFMEGVFVKSKNTATYTFTKATESSGIYIVAIRKF